MKYPRIVEGHLIKQAGKYGTIKNDKGYGIFATRSYRKGELLGTVVGSRVKGSSSKLTHRGIQIGRDLFIEPRRFSLFFYLNHSCDPNTYVDMKDLIARRDIKKGEEITADYSLFTDFPSWDMQCGCRSRKCRGLILPYSKLSPRPKSFVSAFLRK